MGDNSNTSNNSSTQTLSLSQLISGLSIDKKNQLTLMLCEYSKKLVLLKNDQKPPNLTRFLHTLYSNKDNEEAKRFDQFLMQHHIEHYYNGNTILFKVTLDPESSNPQHQLLKIGTFQTQLEKINRLQILKNISAVNTLDLYEKTHISYDYESNDIQEYSSQELNELDEDELNETELCSLEVIPFFKNKDILSCAKRNELSHTNIIELSSQIALTLKHLEEFDLFFSDAASKNWLLGPNNQLYVCDLKSLVTKSFLQTPDCNFYQSPGFIPAECVSTHNNSQQSIDIDKAHAFILGKNIYQLIKPFEALYKTERRIHKIEIIDGHQLNFSDPFFNTPLGKDLQKLVVHLVTPSQTNRLSTEYAYDILQLIKIKNSPESILSSAHEIKLIRKFEAKLKYYGMHNGEIHKMLDLSQSESKVDSLIEIIYQIHAKECEQNTLPLPLKIKTKRDSSSLTFFSYKLSPDHKTRKTAAQTNTKSSLQVQQFSRSRSESESEEDEEDDIFDFEAQLTQSSNQDLVDDSIFSWEEEENKSSQAEDLSRSRLEPPQK